MSTAYGVGIRQLGVLTLVLCAAPTTAWALGDPDGAQSQLDVSSAAPPPPPAVARTAHVHDGFYLRLGVGAGPQWIKLDDDDSRRVYETGGLSLSMDAWVGGSPSPGLAIGGALVFDALGSAELEVDGRGTGLDPDIGVGLLGVFIDAHPNARQGFHAGGALGLSAVWLSELDVRGESLEANGLGAAVWIGHDFWVADEWSIGPLLRFTTTLGSTRDERDVSAVSRGLTLLFTGLYH